MTSRELATVLHALRVVQCEGRIEGCAAGQCEHFADHEPLTNDEIDVLAEHLNDAEETLCMCFGCGRDIQAYESSVEIAGDLYHADRCEPKDGER